MSTNGRPLYINVAQCRRNDCCNRHLFAVCVGTGHWQTNDDIVAGCMAVAQSITAVQCSFSRRRRRANSQSGVSNVTQFCTCDFARTRDGRSRYSARKMIEIILLGGAKSEHTWFTYRYLFGND